MNETADIDKEKIEHSRRSIEEFLTYQEEWLRRAEEAHQKGYDMEAIGICEHQIHSMLRRGLWLKAQSQSLEEHPHVWRNSHLFDLLTDSSQGMMRRARDRELYNAAERFDVIDDETSLRLHTLHDQSVLALREMFDTRLQEKLQPVITKLATDFLAADRECFARLKGSFAAFDSQISALLARRESSAAQAH